MLESKLMNLAEDDRTLEKLLIFIGKGSLTNPSPENRYQVCILQRVSSQLPESTELPDDINDSVTVAIDSTIYPATFERIKAKKKSPEKTAKPVKYNTMSTSHTLKVTVGKLPL